MNTSTNDDLLMIRLVKKPNHHLCLEELQVNLTCFLDIEEATTTPPPPPLNLIKHGANYKQAFIWELTCIKR